MVLVGTQTSHTLAGERRECTLGSTRPGKLQVCRSLSACLHWYLSSTIRYENRIRYCLAWYAFILTYKALIIEFTSLSEMAPFWPLYGTRMFCILQQIQGRPGQKPASATTHQGSHPSGRVIPLLTSTSLD